MLTAIILLSIFLFDSLLLIILLAIKFNFPLHTYGEIILFVFVLPVWFFIKIMKIMIKNHKIKKKWQMRDREN